MTTLKEIAKAAADKMMGWPFPQDFYPDGYIHFDRPAAERTVRTWPTGTNLLTHQQAQAMFEHCLADALEKQGPNTDDAYEIGAKGAEPTEDERMLFEAWMRGHCWKVEGEWNGEQYVHEAETIGIPHAGAMRTRQLWAAWRDRAALALAVQPVESPRTAMDVTIDDLTALVLRMARQLRNLNPECKMADQAVDYVKRKGLTSPFRFESPPLTTNTVVDQKEDDSIDKTDVQFLPADDTEGGGI